MDKRRLTAQQARITWAAEINQNTRAFIEDHTSLYTGHAFTEHVYTTDEKMLDAALSGRKHGDTKFFDERTAEECIGDALFQYIDRIHEFAQYANDGDKLQLQADAAIDADGKPRMVGYGYLSTAQHKSANILYGNKVQKVETNVTGIVIRKNSKSYEGWQIESAFPMSRPDLSQDDATLNVLDEDFSKVLERTPTYQKASPVEQVYMDLTCAGRPFGGSMCLALEPETIPAKRHLGARLKLCQKLDPSSTSYNYQINDDAELNGKVRFKVKNAYLEKAFGSSYECGQIQTTSQNKLLSSNAARIARLIEKKLENVQPQAEYGKIQEAPKQVTPYRPKAPGTTAKKEVKSIKNARRLPDTSHITGQSGLDGPQR